MRLSWRAPDLVQRRWFAWYAFRGGRMLCVGPLRVELGRF